MSDDQSAGRAQVHDTTEVLVLVEELEQRLGQLKHWQRDHDEFLQQLKVQQAELETKQNELAEHGQRLQQWQQKLDAQRGDQECADISPPTATRNFRKPRKRSQHTGPGKHPKRCVKQVAKN